MYHKKCRAAVYPGTEKKPVFRTMVTDQQVPWETAYETSPYSPNNYTAPVVLAKPSWADPEDPNAVPLKEYEKRAVHTRIVRDSQGFPLNPMGRTGMVGRGILGKFGPNHAADPIVTRWKRDAEGNICRDAPDGQPILEFVAIKRNDTGEWAIPGGMVEEGHTVSATLKKEFGEEAMDTMQLTNNERETVRELIEQLFANGTTVYKGYVDDPRNTDNSWMETIAVNFHDNIGNLTSRFKLKAGDDAGDVKWMTIEPGLKLYASHLDFIQRVCDRRGALSP